MKNGYRDKRSVELPQNPIFIVGYPRSGTTLLQAMLATQNGLLSMPETHFFNVVYRAILLNDQGTIESACLDEVFRRIGEKAGIDFSEQERHCIASAARQTKLSPKDLFEIIVLRYVEPQARQLLCDSYRWIEKTPNHAYFLETIHGLYPRAQFLNLIRNPLRAIHSRRTKFPFNNETAVTTLARMWVRSVTSAEDFSRRHPGKVYTLRYEDLVQNVEREFTALCQFLNVMPDFRLIKRYGTEAEKLTHRWETWKTDVKSGILLTALDARKADFSLRDLLRIQKVTEKKMREYHYHLSNPISQRLYNFAVATAHLRDKFTKHEPSDAHATE